MKPKELLNPLSTLVWAALASLMSTGAVAQNADASPPDSKDDELGEVIVTGFRASLQNSVAQKRENVAFSDSIFAEDIGKFPDLNLAESLQRIPGVQIARDFTGEGTSVAVRGLGRDFTQITLNGAPVETASDSNIDNVSQGRGLDLVLFPTELFRQLTVTKTPTARQAEGAIAANVDLRIARPFDKKGFHFNYSAKANYQESSEDWSPRLGAYISNTWDTGLGEFGALAGVAYSNRKYRSDGFNTIGYTTVTLGTRCAFATDPGCNSFRTPNDATGYGNQAQAWPTTVPAGYSFGANGLNAGDPLTVCGAGGAAGGTSGLSCRDLSFAIWPRLARPDALFGERETRSEIVALQWAPSESLSFYFDGLHSKADHVYERNVLNLAVRSTNTNVPVDVQLNEDNVVTHATLANPQWLNENRPYDEDTDFMNLSLGSEWKVTDAFTVDASLNYNHSDWFRSTNTYLINSLLNTGITAEIDSGGDGVIKVTPSRDLNNPNFWVWNALRIQPVQREVWQKGAHVDGEYAFSNAFKLGAGFSRDNFHREITNWETTSCATDGGNTSSPAGQQCTAALLAAGIQNAKVAIPNAQLGQYMQLWTHGTLYNTSDFDVGLNNGWALPNYRLLDPQVNIDFFEKELAVGLVGGLAVANYNPRVIDEQTDALFVEANGQLEMLGKLRYNVGVRRIDTDQFLSGYVVTGGALQQFEKSYDKLLPSFNVASELGHGLLLRAAASKSMTRAQPGDMAPNGALSINGDVFTIGNPQLAPYFSDNYDLGIEWYFGDSGLGVVALNGWRKEIEGYSTVIGTPTPFGQLGIDYSTLPIATQTGIQNTANAQCSCTTGVVNGALVRVDQRFNTDELITLDGVEVTYVQPLDFLLNGAGFSLNYTHIQQKSEGGRPGAPSSAITGLSPYTYNITAFYENFGFSGRLSWSVRDAFIEFLGNNENNLAGDNFAQKRSYLDASFGYKLPIETNVSISLELQNLTNEQLLTYFRDDPLTPRASFAPGRQVLLGVVGSF
ncbi:MAG: TonB-dependent receptor [Pseudomonadota bacterium]